MFKFKKLTIALLTVLFFVTTAYAAVTLTISNEFKYAKGIESINFSADTHKVILLEDGFVFDPDADGAYSDISAEEITSAGGYVVGGYSLTVDSAWAQNNTNDTAEITWTDYTFTASGAAFDTFCAACIICTVDGTTDAADLIVGCIELGQDIDIADGSSFQLQDLGYTAN